MGFREVSAIDHGIENYTVVTHNPNFALNL